MSNCKCLLLFCILITVNCTKLFTSEIGRGTLYREINIGQTTKLDNRILNPRTNSIKQVIYSLRDRQIRTVENLPELRSIFIEKANQQFIPEFKNVPKLTDVYMQSNEFVYIKKENFGYTNSVYLFLRFNSIYQIEDGSFGPKVKHVYLQCNNLKRISPEWFQNASVLNVLDLDENDIEYIEDGTFKDFKKLEYVYLVANGLKKIGDNAFSGSKTNFISELWLGSNELTELSPKIFGDSRIMFERLDITYNKLTFLTKDFFDRVNVTVSLSLEDNPWQCTCYYYQILPWGGKSVSPDLSRQDEPKCVGDLNPGSMRCKYWVDNSLIDFYRKELTPPPKNRDEICTKMII